MDIKLGSKVRVINGFYKGVEGIINYRFSGEEKVYISFFSNCGDPHKEMVKIVDIEII